MLHTDTSPLRIGILLDNCGSIARYYLLLLCLHELPFFLILFLLVISQVAAPFLIFVVIILVVILVAILAAVAN